MELEKRIEFDEKSNRNFKSGPRASKTTKEIIGILEKWGTTDNDEFREVLSRDQFKDLKPKNTFWIIKKSNNPLIAFIQDTNLRQLFFFGIFFYIGYQIYCFFDKISPRNQLNVLFNIIIGIFILLLFIIYLPNPQIEIQKKKTE